MHLKTIFGNLFKRMTGPEIIDLTIGEGRAYPEGFFRVQTASGEMSLGFNSGAPQNTHYIPARTPIQMGAKLVRVPQGQNESLEDAIARLPLVRLRFRSHRDGRMSVNGYELQDTDGLPGEWDGITKYDGDHKGGDDEKLDGGLWR
jgi:hypothetical protein